MRITLRVALPRRFLDEPARPSVRGPLPGRSWRRSLADLILSLTLAPPLTFWKVVNSGLPEVVRTPRRAMPVPAGAVNATGTPAENAWAVTAVGVLTAAMARGAAVASASAPAPVVPAP